MGRVDAGVGHHLAAAADNFDGPAAHHQQSTAVSTWRRACLAGDGCRAGRPRRGWTRAIGRGGGRRQSIGIVAFIFSEATFFGALIVAFLLYRTASPGASPRDLDVPRTFFFSLFLFASSGTVYLAERQPWSR